MSTESIHTTFRGIGHRDGGRHAGRRMGLFSVLILLLGGAIVGCGLSPPIADNNSVTLESRSIAAGNVTSAHVQLTMQPGNLQVDGGSSQLVNARFIYRPSSWRPTISYKVSNGQGQLVIDQPKMRSVTNGKNTWSIQLSNTMPVDLVVTSGPGNATLNLTSLKLNTSTVSTGPGNVTVNAGSPSLKTLNVSTGPGNLTVTLNAKWTHDVTATINSGIGNTTLWLPEQTGTQVVVQGTGHVEASDLAEQNGTYVNSAFGHTTSTVHVSLNAGIGNVVLLTGTQMA
ncbi:MAG TPA: toast rack family protein [Chloroflexota bacterium]